MARESLCQTIPFLRGQLEDIYVQNLQEESDVYPTGHSVSNSSNYLNHKTYNTIFCKHNY